MTLLVKLSLLDRGPLHLHDVPHTLRDPAMMHRVPPSQVPHVPALRPTHGIPPRMVHPMAGYRPHTSMPTRPPTMMLPMDRGIQIPLPHPVQNPFAPPLFDSVLPPGDLGSSSAPPMSEEEFYRLQKKLKYKTDTRYYDIVYTKPVNSLYCQCTVCHVYGTIVYAWWLLHVVCHIVTESAGKQHCGTHSKPREHPTSMYLKMFFFALIQ